MMEWLETSLPEGYLAAILWIAAALVLFVLVLFVVKLIRGLRSGTFVAGGRNRRARLAVMDATAVDSRRRLVLVRRDDVEHLILIGGPTDVVVEQNIRVVARAPRPQSAEPEGRAAAAPAQGEERPRHPPPPQPVEPPATRAASAPHATLPRPPMPMAPPPQPTRQAAAPAAVGMRRTDAPQPPAPAAPVKEASLEEEMSRILGELSNGKRS